MEHYDYLKKLLRPMCVYDMDGVCSNGELKAEGAALDDICDDIDDLTAESTVPTAETYGLTSYEAILPPFPHPEELQHRRSAIMALLQIDETSFTYTALNATLSGCGIPAHVEESDDWYTVDVTFPGIRGIPPQFDMLSTRIEAILPCHLNVRYRFSYLIWSELENFFHSWTELESGPRTWDALQTWE